MAQGSTGQPPRLSDGHILVGNSANIASDVAMTGDVTITNAGATTISADVALAGDPTTTTQAPGDNSTKLATTAFVLANALTDSAGTCVDNTLRRADGTTGKISQKTGIVASDEDELSLYRANEIADTGTSRTLSATVDGAATITFSNAAVVAVTLPNNLPKGFFCHLIQGGWGQVQLAAASGATINSYLNYTATLGKNAVVRLEVTANSDGSHAVYSLSGMLGSPTSPLASPILASLQQVQVTIAPGATTGTATIAAVDPTKSYVHWQGQTNEAPTYTATTTTASVTLTDATTVTATRAASDASYGLTIYGTVVEFVSAAIQSIQQGAVAIGAAATSATAAISDVTLANTVVHFQGSTFAATTDEGAKRGTQGRVALTNTTTVTATRGTASATTLTVNFVAIEFAAGVLASATQSFSGAGTGSAPPFPLSPTINPEYTMLFYGGYSSTESTGEGDSTPISALAGNRRAIIYGAGQGTGATMIAEFLPAQINRIQRGGQTILINNTTAANTIKSVDLTRTLFSFLGTISDLSDARPSTNQAGMQLADATTVTLTRNSASATTQIMSGFEIIEFA